MGLGFVLAFIFGCAGAAIGYRQQERRIAATLAQHAFQRRRHDAMVAPIEAELAELQSWKLSIVLTPGAQAAPSVTLSR